MQIPNTRHPEKKLMSINLIKKANSESEYTPETIQELKKCANDPVHFIRNYIWLQHPEQGRILFDLYDFQVELIRAMQQNRWVITLMARQMGKCFSGSTLINTIQQPSKLKMAVLRIVDKEKYENAKRMFGMQDKIRDKD